MWDEIRLWVLPGLGIISLLWQAATAMRRNVLTRDELKGYATSAELSGAITALHDEAREIETAATGAHHRVDLIEERMKGLPDYDTVNTLRDIVATLNATVLALKSEVKALDDKLDTQGTVITRIEQHLLNQVRG